MRNQENKLDERSAKSDSSIAEPDLGFPQISYFSLFRYSTVGEKLLTIFGVLLSIAVGVLVPTNIVVFRGIVNVLTEPPVEYPRARSTAIFFAIVGVIVLITSFVHAMMLGYVAKRQLRTIRLLYFKALLRQDVSWFEQNHVGSLMIKLSHDTSLIEDGIGTKLGEFVQNVSSFVCGILFSFYYGWKLTLVACAMLPFTVTAFTLFGVLTKYYSAKQLKAYARAGQIAHQALAAIRTVLAFGGEEKELKRYSKELRAAESVGIKKDTVMGGVTGAVGLTLYTSTALIFWYGIQLLIEHETDAGTIILVFMNITMGSLYLGSALPFLQHFANAQTAARNIFGTIGRKPQIDRECSGKHLIHFIGNIQFRNVVFAYPSRPDVPVLQNFNLKIEGGKTVALVGTSGSGKSTIVNLLLRHYDATAGQVTIDGVDIRDLDLNHYLSQVACVQQEPVLFDGTVAENIRMGQLNATQAMIEEAAKLANAHQFISNLPQGYDTVIGQQGSGLSGGQRQRLALARALIRRPKLLLLDEATSALDTRSEREVQKALEGATRGRTVLMVAHRLSTIRRADLIIVMEKGVICESGTHDELVAKNGLYAAMLRETAPVDGSVSVLPRGDDVDINTDQRFPDGVWKRKQEDDNCSLNSEVVESGEDIGDSESGVLTILRRNKSVLCRMLRLNLPELWQIILGCLFCMGAGSVQPAFAIVYSEIYGIFLKENNTLEMQTKVNSIAWRLAVVGLARFIAMLAQGYFLGVAGERLIKRVRVMSFEAMMKQEVAWFDRPENQVAQLTTKLADEVRKVRSVSGLQLGAFSEACVLSIASLATSFFQSWQLTLMFLAFFPIIVVTGMFRIRNLAGVAKGDLNTHVMNIPREALENYQTTFALNLEDYFYNRFKERLDAKRKATNSACALFALVYATTQSVSMFSTSALFALGAYLISLSMLPIPAVFRVYAIMNLAAQSLARTASFGSLAIKASVPARIILETIDRRSQIPTYEGLIPDVPFRGKVSFKRLCFHYPTRSTIPVLQNFNFTVEPGQTVAVVGESGCGKSTLMQLIQRFYDPSDHGPDSGVFFDGYNLRHLAPVWIRRQIGIVSQEPVLFDTTIEENIAYGDNTRIVPIDDIIEAAKLANIHDFIMSLPQGYQTRVGLGVGAQLSGGQKQRIAIARALVRKPALLLLDEATSALDAANERIVQEALDNATDQPRTALVVAHRLNTVENADIIVVIDGGQPVEYGPPAALLASKGAFYALTAAEQSQR